MFWPSILSTSINEDYDDDTIKIPEDEMEYYDYEQYLLEEEKFWGYKYR